MPHGLPGIYFKLEVLNRFRLDRHWSTKQKLQSATGINQRKQYFSMNETNERSAHCSCKTWNLKEILDKGFCTFWKVCQGRRAKNESQESHNRQHYVRPVCLGHYQGIALWTGKPRKQGFCLVSLTGVNLVVWLLLKSQYWEEFLRYSYLQ